MKIFPSVRIEGGLFGPDILEQILRADLPGQKPADFQLDSKHSLTDEIASTFADARAQWNIFRHRSERLPDSDLGTSLTRDSWIIPFLSLFNYKLQYNPRAYEVDGLTFAISHRADENDQAPPVHIVGFRQDLSRLAPSGRPRLAPHSLLQEYLNRTDHLWGIVTNGYTLRLLRDCTYIRRQAYIEFDLTSILEEQRFEDFILLFRLLHRTRLPHTMADAQKCLLETYYQHSLEQGERVRNHLRDGVEDCLKKLANGFIAHPANENLRRKFTSSDSHTKPIEPREFFHEILRLVYRFLFLLVSEDRGLISPNPLYREHYGIARLRRLVNIRAAFNDYDDIWFSLRVLWKVLSDEKLAPLLDVAPLNGELFTPLDIDSYSISNRDFLEAFWHLAYYQEKASEPARLVNYAALDTEELGSVYESLLEYHPQIDTSGVIPRFELAFGSERKSTGSYYTAPELVTELIRSALEPVLEEKLKVVKTPLEKEKALLSIRVLDPACGSGHFLLAAARRLGKELARLRTDADEPAPEPVREAIRDVISHCIYGVDKNPLAVELCRVALWLEAHCQGKPLTFLDHRIKCGDSLVGVLDLTVLEKGIPDDAFTTASDNKKIVNLLKKRNRDEQRDLETGQLSLTFHPEDVLPALSRLEQELSTISDDSPAEVRRKKIMYETQQTDRERQKIAKMCDLWTAAFFQRIDNNDGLKWEKVITTRVVMEQLAGRAHPQAMAQAEVISDQQHFFHWALEFPEIFSPSSYPTGRGSGGEGGFDVLLANPPWERIKLQEQEFFAERDARIATAPNAAARKRLIERLPQENPALWADYRRALHTAESASRFLRGSGAYPLTGRGDINTYSVFAERIRQLVAPDGRAGVILPTGIATDATNQYFFADLVEEGQIVSLYDFDNREKLFPAVISLMKFSLFTIRGSGDKRLPVQFAFFCHKTEDIHKAEKQIRLMPGDLALLNPNTRTLPVFRTRQDAELTKTIYQRVPVLVNEAKDENPWGVRFLRMFDMSSDSHLFRTRNQLEAEGFRLEGNVFVKGDPHSPLAIRYSPLYEAKMIWHYDHRFGTYEGVTDRSSTHLPTPDDRQHADPHFLALPWYWVDAAEVQARLGAWTRGWLLGFRRIARSTDERTAIFTIMPRVGAGDNVFLMLPDANSTMSTALAGSLISFPFDWVVRQKLAGVNMNFFYVQQFPVLPPAAYTQEDLRFIVPRVIELTYTAWDLAPFAADLWHDADDTLRAAIQAQWQANAAATGSVDSTPQAWLPGLETDPKSVPFPPFKWDEFRCALLRAELDAYYARLYGLTRKQLRYILDPADLTARELADILDPHEEVADPLDPQGYAARVAASDFPGETFRVLKDKELRQYGEYRTRRLVLEAWKKYGSQS